MAGTKEKRSRAEVTADLERKVAERKAKESYLDAKRNATVARKNALTLAKTNYESAKSQIEARFKDSLDIATKDIWTNFPDAAESILAGLHIGED